MKWRTVEKIIDACAIMWCLSVLSMFLLWLFEEAVL